MPVEIIPSISQNSCHFPEKVIYVIPVTSVTQNIERVSCSSDADEVHVASHCRRAHCDAVLWPRCARREKEEIARYEYGALQAF